MQYVEGMTWRDYIYSDYNNEGLISYGPSSSDIGKTHENTWHDTEYWYVTTDKLDNYFSCLYAEVNRVHIYELINSNTNYYLARLELVSPALP